MWPNSRATLVLADPSSISSSFDSNWQRVHLSLWFEEKSTLNKLWTAQDWADGVNVFFEGYCNQATNFADFYATLQFVCPGKITIFKNKYCYELNMNFNKKYVP